MANYEMKKSVWKGLRALVLFVIPAALDHFMNLYPDYWNLGIGAALVMIWDGLRRTYLVK